MAGASETNWKFGLANSAGKYLTAEKFQSTINANAPSLKSKQVWTLERVTETVVALRSSYKKYLSAFKNGDLNATGDDIGPEQKFELATQPDGKVAIRSVTYERYVRGGGDALKCDAKKVDEDSLFTIHLAVHPQINLKNVNRKMFVHLQDNELRCNEEIPWGYDAMLILEFHSGKYALRAANEKYLARTGQLVDALVDDTLYTLVFREALIAFKDSTGKFLTAVGPNATIKSRKDTLGKDELFAMEDSHPQVRLTASNGKYVSTRDKVNGEVRANQSDSTDSEIFQMMAVDRGDRSGNVKWAFLSNNGKFWNNGRLIANEPNFSSDKTHFEIQWMGPMIALKGNGGKYVSVTANGQMSASSTECSDSCKFQFDFVNRPVLVLKGDYGFVGAKSPSGVLECNRAQYDVFRVESNKTTGIGKYEIKGANGKYWKVEGDGSIVVGGDKGDHFCFELRAHTRMCIVAPNGQYIKGVQNGGFLASGATTVANDTLWEY